MQINGAANVHASQPINAPHRAQPTQPTARPDQTTGVDQLDISHEADMASRISEIPDIRADRVAEIRAQIEAGVYETDEKLNVAVERLFDEIG